VSRRFLAFSRRTCAILSAATLIPLTLGLGQGTANAAKSECLASPARLCIWDGANYSGARYEYGGDWSGCVNIPTTWNDRVSSVYNRMIPPVTVYEHANCTGANAYFRSGISANLGSNLNNKVTSFWFGD
jgi:Peptidase inhibitor family I36